MCDLHQTYTRQLRACLVGLKVYNGNGNGIKFKEVKIESRVKLGNNEIIKFMRPKKNVR